MGKQKVKVVSVRYGLLGHPHNKNIEKAMSKWLSKGYELKTREESGSGYVFGRTHLTFILPDGK